MATIETKSTASALPEEAFAPEISSEKKLDAIALSLKDAANDSSKILLQKARQLREKVGVTGDLQERTNALMAELKETVPSAYQSTVEKLKSPDSLTGAKEVAEGAKKTVEGAVDSLKDSIKSSTNIDKEQLNKVADDVGDKLGGKIKEVASAAGVITVGGMIKEVAKGVGEMVSSIGDFIGKIIEFFKRLFSGIFSGSGLGDLFGDTKKEVEKKVDALGGNEVKKGIVGAKEAYTELKSANSGGNPEKIALAKKKFNELFAPLISQSSLSPEDKKWVTDTLKELNIHDLEKVRKEGIQKAKKYIEDRFFAGAELSEDRYKAFMKVMEEHKFSDELILSKFGKIREKGELSVEDIAEVMERYVFSSGTLIMKLVLSNVIPLHKIAFSAIESTAVQGINSGKQYLALTLDGINIPPASFGMDELQGLAEKYKDSPRERGLLLYMYSKPAGIAAAVAGSIIGGGMSIVVGFATPTTVDALKKMTPAYYKGYVGKEYGPLIENFKKLEDALGAEVALGGRHSVQLQELEKMTQRIGENYTKLQELEVKCKTLSPAEADKLRKATRELIGQSIPLNMREGFINFAKKLGGGTEGRMIEQFDYLQGIINTQARLAVREVSVVKYYKDMEELSKVVSISRVQDTTMLMLKEGQTLKELGPALMKLSASGVKHFFNGIPLIGLAVGTKDLMQDKKKQTELSEWANMIAGALSMPWAGWVLFRDSTVSIKDGGVNLENGATGALGATLLTASGVYILKNVTRPMEVVKFATGYNTLKQAGNTGAAIWRGGVIARKVGPKFAAAIGESMEVAMKAPGRTKAVAAGIAIAVATAIYLGKQILSTDPEKAAVEAGYIDKDGKLTPKLAQDSKNIPKEGKQEIFDAVTFAEIKRVLQLDNITSHYEAFSKESGVYEVYASTVEETRKIQEAVNPLSDNFASLGLGNIEVVTQEKKKAS